MHLSRSKSTVIVILLAAATALCGCQSMKEKVLERRRPRSFVFQTQEQLPDIRLSEGEKGSMVLFERTESQSLHVLQVARDAQLAPRYHTNQDLTLLCISGSAIVEIEGTVYLLGPRSAILVPRLYTYRIVPHGSEEDFAAIAVFSPPYQPEDLVLVQRD